MTMKKMTFAVTAVAAACCLAAPWDVPPAKLGPANVMDYGAKGDGVHDDTPNIQAAINAVAARGGGKVFFPFTKKGYLLASPAQETVGGKPCRSQLYIPPTRLNIQLEGEMPCLLLNTYTVMGEANSIHDCTRFGTQHDENVKLVSGWKPPVETNEAAKPWSMLSVLPGYSGEGYPLNGSLVSLANLEFRAYLDKEKMCAVQTAADLSCASRAIVRDCQFGLTDQVGDGSLGKDLQKSSVPAAGLIMSRELNDDQVIYNVNVQGFKYGIVMAEHTHGLYLYLHNNENALCFTGSAHLSKIDFVTAQHNTRILTTHDGPLFARCPSKKPVFVSVLGVDIEDGRFGRPVANRLEYGVYDPSNRLRGKFEFHMLNFGYSAPEEGTLPVCGAKYYQIERFGGGAGAWTRF